MSCPSRARRLPRRPPARALCYKQLNQQQKTCTCMYTHMYNVYVYVCMFVMLLYSCM